MARILVVDDDPFICGLVEECLREDGHEPWCVTDPVAALAEAERFRPDLVVTDLMMPGLDGAALITALRTQGVAAPMLVLTAVPERAAGLDVDAVLAKPFDLDHLCAAVMRALA